MATNFQFKALDMHLFSSYFEMTPSELTGIGAYFFESDEYPCYPCRVSLEDAQIGETVLAITYEHNSVLSPYRSSGPIFIRANVHTAVLEQNEVPDLLRHRLLSIRGYDNKGIMKAADTAPGIEVESVLKRQFNDESVEYIQIHNAGPGCFNCTVHKA